MRVLLVTNMYPTERDPVRGIFVALQVESLRALGIDIDVEIIDGARSKADYLWAARRVRRQVARNRYDLVHAHYGLSGFVAVQQRQRPVCITFCGSDLEGIPDDRGRPTLNGVVQVLLSRIAARRADKVIVQSRVNGRYLDGIAPYEVIANGIDIHKFAPMDRAAAREQLGIRDAHPRVLFVGRHTATVKRLWLAEEAVRRLRVSEPNVELMVMSGRPQHEIVAAMSAADCLVLTSSHEGSPNVVKEAMACNLPVVSTRVGDVAELFSGAPGHFLSSDRPDEVAEHLRRAIHHGRTEGRKLVEHLSLEAVAERVLGIYRAMLGESSRA